MKATAALFASALLTTGIASAATVQTSQTIEITGAGWNAGTLGGGTISFSGLGGGLFSATASASGNSTVTVDGGGFHMMSNVAGSSTSVQTGITGLRQTGPILDRVAWIELDISGFDPGDNTLSTFLGTNAFGVYISNVSGINHSADGTGFIAFNSPISSSTEGGSATLRFQTPEAVAFGQNGAYSTTMFWNHLTLGSDLNLTAVRFGIETLETVPEPSALALGSLGLLPLFRRRRK